MDGDTDVDNISLNVEIREDVGAELEEYVRLNHSGDYDRADQLYHECLEKHLDWFPVTAEYGDCLLRQGRHDELKSLCMSRLDSLTDRNERDIMRLLGISSEMNSIQETAYTTYVDSSAFERNMHVVASIWEYMLDVHPKARLQDTKMHCVELLLQILSKGLSMVNSGIDEDLNYDGAYRVHQRLRTRLGHSYRSLQPLEMWTLGETHFHNLLRCQYDWEAQRILQSLPGNDLILGTEFLAEESGKLRLYSVKWLGLAWIGLFELFLSTTIKCDDESVAIAFQAARASFSENLKRCYPSPEAISTYLQRHIDRIIKRCHVHVFGVLFDPWPSEITECAWRQSDLIRLFLALCDGADIRKSPVMYAIESLSETMLLAVLSLLRRSSVGTLNRTINALGPEGETPLMAAVSSSRPRLPEILLQEGARIDTQDRDGRPALIYAAKSRNTEMISILLEHGADISCKDRHGRDALSYAVQSNDLKIIQILLDRGADISYKDRHGRDALSYAVQSNDPKIVQILLDRGADISYKDHHGKDVLLYAVQSNDLKIVQILLDCGADVSSKDTEGRDALSYAAQSGDIGIFRTLLVSGATLHAENYPSSHAARIAARSGDAELIQYLDGLGIYEELCHAYKERSSRREKYVDAPRSPSSDALQTPSSKGYQNFRRVGKGP